MLYRSLWLILLCLALSAPLPAQLSQEARFQLIRNITAEQAAARIAMPFGADGVQLSDTGEINQEDLAKQIKKNGRSIEAGRVVTVTNVELGDKSIEIELDGGGKSKRSIFDRIQVGIGPGGGGGGAQPPNAKDKPRGSKVTLKFAQKIAAGLTAERLKELLNPVLDFTKSNFLRAGIDALPPEFQEAVKAKEARIGMDRSTVILALGRPDERVRETNADSVELEDWIYHLRGNRTTYVTFDLNQNVVVGIRQY